MKRSWMSFAVLLTLSAFLFLACGKKESQEQAQTQQQQSSQMMEHQQMGQMGQMGGMMQSSQLAEDEAIDPVCGMKIKKADAKVTHEYNGKTYYFCMENDYKAFMENPEKYVAQK